MIARHRRLRSGPLLGDGRSRVLHDRRLGAASRAQRGSSHPNGDHGWPAEGAGCIRSARGCLRPATVPGSPKESRGARLRHDRQAPGDLRGTDGTNTPQAAPKDNTRLRFVVVRYVEWWQARCVGSRPASRPVGNEPWAAQRSYCEQRAAHASLATRPTGYAWNTHQPNSDWTPRVITYCEIWRRPGTSRRSLIAESDTFSCTWRAKPHENVALSAIKVGSPVACSHSRSPRWRLLTEGSC